jgi:hypothetical protein
LEVKGNSILVFDPAECQFGIPSHVSIEMAPSLFVAITEEVQNTQAELVQRADPLQPYKLWETNSPQHNTVRTLLIDRLSRAQRLAGQLWEVAGPQLIEGTPIVGMPVIRPKAAREEKIGCPGEVRSRRGTRSEWPRLRG